VLGLILAIFVLGALIRVAAIAIAPVWSANPTTLAQAQTLTPFPIRVPHCLPASIDPRPVVEVRPTTPDPITTYADYHAVLLTYRATINPRNPLGDRAIAVTLNQQRNGSGEHHIYQVGLAEQLEGRDVVIHDPVNPPLLAWIQDGVYVQLSTDLPWPATLRLYHTITTDSSDCAAALALYPDGPINVLQLH